MINNTRKILETDISFACIFYITDKIKENYNYYSHYSENKYNEQQYKEFLEFNERYNTPFKSFIEIDIFLKEVLTKQRFNFSFYHNDKIHNLFTTYMFDYSFYQLIITINKINDNGKIKSIDLYITTYYDIVYIRDIDSFLISNPNIKNKFFTYLNELLN